MGGLIDGSEYVIILRCGLKRRPRIEHLQEVDH